MRDNGDTSKFANLLASIGPIAVEVGKLAGRLAIEALTDLFSDDTGALSVTIGRQGFVEGTTPPLLFRLKLEVGIALTEDEELGLGPEGLPEGSRLFKPTFQTDISPQLRRRDQEGGEE